MIRQLRVQAGLKPGAVAKAAGVNYQTYYRFERGGNGVSKEVQYRILNAVNTLLGTSHSLEEMLSETEGKAS